MSARDPRPRTGPLLSWLLRRRLDTEQRDRILDELAELHEHRVRSLGPAEANRRLRRELRRLTLRLFRGNADHDVVRILEFAIRHG